MACGICDVTDQVVVVIAATPTVSIRSAQWLWCGYLEVLRQPASASCVLQLEGQEQVPVVSDPECYHATLLLKAFGSVPESAVVFKIVTLSSLRYMSV